MWVVLLLVPNRVTISVSIWHPFSSSLHLNGHLYYTLITYCFILGYQMVSLVGKDDDSKTTSLKTQRNDSRLRKFIQFRDLSSRFVQIITNPLKKRCTLVPIPDGRKKAGFIDENKPQLGSWLPKYTYFNGSAIMMWGYDSQNRPNTSIITNWSVLVHRKAFPPKTDT